MITKKGDKMAIGDKFDNGKPPVAEMLLDFDDSIMELAKVWDFGARKYAKDNWKKVPDAKNRYMNALCRHLLQSKNEPLDSESGISHIAHACFNALAILHFDLEENKKRFTK